METPNKPDLKPGDLHFVISHVWRSLKVYSSNGGLLHKTDARTDGTAGSDTTVTNGDTPHILWEFTGQMVPNPDPTNAAIYGYMFMYIRALQPHPRGDVGIGVHSGRQNQYAPTPSHPHDLWVTHGCIRVHEEDQINWMVKLVRDTISNGHRAYISVFGD